MMAELIPCMKIWVLLIFIPFAEAEIPILHQRIPTGIRVLFLSACQILSTTLRVCKTVG